MSKPLSVADYLVKDARWRLPPMKIALLSDLHAQHPWVSLSKIEAIVRQTNGLKPDLVLLGGDYLIDVKQRLFGRSIPARDCLIVLRDLQAPLGTFGILGNHDWGDCPEAHRSGFETTSVIRAHHDAGIPLLRNQSVALSHSGHTFWLVGTDSQRAIMKSNPKRFISFLDADTAFENVSTGAPCIHLAHEPDYFANGDSRAFLQLSGHTHGGQIKLFGRTPVVPSDYGDRYVGGYIQENGNHLIVSRGIGTSGIPLRLGVPPELVMVTVTSER